MQTLQNWINSSGSFMWMDVQDLGTVNDRQIAQRTFGVREYPTLIVAQADAPGGIPTTQKHVGMAAGFTEIARFSGPDANAQSVYDTLLNIYKNTGGTGTGYKLPGEEEEDDDGLTGTGGKLPGASGTEGGTGTGGKGGEDPPKPGDDEENEFPWGWIIVGVVALLFIVLISRLI